MIEAELQEKGRSETGEGPSLSAGDAAAAGDPPPWDHPAERYAAAPSWTVTVEDQVYGPYELDRMLAFIGEGRVTIATMVSLAGSDSVHPVSDDPVLSRLFYTADLDEFVAGERVCAGEQDMAELGARQALGAVPGVRHFMIAAEVKWPVNRFEAAMLALGASYQLMESSWLLSSAEDFDTVCKTLIQNIGPKDKLLVSDLSRDRMASFNLGEEAALGLHRVWRGVTPISQVLGIWSAAERRS